VQVYYVTNCLQYLTIASLYWVFLWSSVNTLHNILLKDSAFPMHVTLFRAGGTGVIGQVIAGPLIS